jgi:hypothetical protein
VFAGDEFLPEYEDSFDSEKFGSKYLHYKYSDTIKLGEGKYWCPNHSEYCTKIASGRFNKVDGS